MSDYGEYNGDTVHDMWVDYTYDEYIGELGYWNGDGGSPQRNRGGGYHSAPSKRSTSELIDGCRKRIARNESRIKGIEADIEQTKKSLENPNLSTKKIRSLQYVLENLPKTIAQYREAIEKDQAKLIPLLMKREKQRNLWTIGACIFAILASVFIFWLIF